MGTMPSAYGLIPTSQRPNSTPFALRPNIWTPIQPLGGPYNGLPPTLPHQISSVPVPPIIGMRSLQCLHHIQSIRPQIPIHHGNLVCLVCDTNIFIHHLNEIWRIVLDLTTYSNIILGIPWKIHKELDGLKKSENLELARNSRKAANSIEFILRFLKHRTLTQNKVSYDRAKLMFQCEDADDSILQAILQLQSQGTPTLLYSKDTVLKNKALSIGIRLFEFLTPTPTLF